MQLQKVSGGWTIWWGNNKPICKSFSIGFHKEWFKCSKENPPFMFHTNGARKGVDSCFDCTLKLWPFYFGYTDWSYNRFRKAA